MPVATSNSRSMRRLLSARDSEPVSVTAGAGACAEESTADKVIRRARNRSTTPNVKVSNTLAAESKNKVQRKLHNSRISGKIGDLSELTARDIVIGNAKVCVVERVQHVPP